MLTVACVLRSGGDFDAEYVERLCAGVAEHLPIEHRFICLSDVPVPCERIQLRHDWPGWWAKMELFAPGLAGGVLYFDLDTVINGDLTDIASVGRLTMLNGFYDSRKKLGTGQRPVAGTGLMYLTEADRAEIWTSWIKAPVFHMKQYRGDQNFIDPIVGHRAARWDVIAPGQVVSYKLNVRPASGAENARAVCFHGKPRPRDVNWMAA
jgi:hypothetical protein